MQRVQTGEAGADDDCVVVLRAHLRDATSRPRRCRVLQRAALDRWRAPRTWTGDAGAGNIAPGEGRAATDGRRALGAGGARCERSRRGVAGDAGPGLRPVRRTTRPRSCWLLRRTR